MPTKPTTVPTWNTGAANRTTPSAGKQALGWEPNEDPSSSYFNWLGFHAYEWCNWVSLGSSAPDADAHVVETNSSGVASVRRLQAGPTGLSTGASLQVNDIAADEPSVYVEKAITGTAAAVYIACTDNVGLDIDSQGFGVGAHAHMRMRALSTSPLGLADGQVWMWTIPASNESGLAYRLGGVTRRVHASSGGPYHLSGVSTALSSESSNVSYTNKVTVANIAPPAALTTLLIEVVFWASATASTTQMEFQVLAPDGATVVSDTVVFFHNDTNGNEKNVHIITTSGTFSTAGNWILRFRSDTNTSTVYMRRASLRIMSAEQIP